MGRISQTDKKKLLDSNKEPNTGTACTTYRQTQDDLINDFGQMKLISFE